MDSVLLHNDTRKIYKDNAIVAATNKMTLIEQRLLLLAIAKIDPRQSIPCPLIIRADDYAETFGLPLDGCYKALKSATEKLFTRQIVALDNETGFDKLHWLSRARYVAQNATAHLYFSQEIEPYLVNLQGQFTKYELKRIARLNSVHSIRLFELLQRFKKNGYYTVSLDEFRDLMGLSAGYARFNNLKSKILEPAIAELKAKSGLIVGFNTQKTGKTVERLVFFFHDDSQMSLKLEQDVPAST